MVFSSKKHGFPGFRKPGLQGFQKPGKPGVRKPGLQGFPKPGFPDFPKPGIRSFQIQLVRQTILKQKILSSFFNSKITFKTNPTNSKKNIISILKLCSK